MRRKFIPLVFLLFSISWAAVSAQDCPAIVQNALSRAQTACAIMRSNQACYGYPALEVQLQEGLSPFAFNGVGDITPIDTIQSLHMSALDPAKDEWGVALMRVRADITSDQPNENVTLLAFGEVSIDPDISGNFQPMQAFALKTGDTESGCTNITENGLLIQTPEGVGRVTLWINDVRVRVGSTALFQAQPGGDMTVSTFEGHVEVQARGGTQEAAAGMRVRVPMDEDMHPTGMPTVPEAFDTADTANADLASVAEVVDVTTSYTDGTVVELIPASEASADVSDDGSAGALDDPATSDASGCNGDHGNGNGNGNCNGHDNQPGNGNGNAGGNGNGNGNAGGNGNGNGNGNAGGNGNGNGNAGGNGNGNGNAGGNGNGNGNGNAGGNGNGNGNGN